MEALCAMIMGQLRAVRIGVAPRVGSVDRGMKVERGGRYGDTRHLATSGFISPTSGFISPMGGASTLIGCAAGVGCGIPPRCAEFGDVTRG